MFINGGRERERELEFGMRERGRGFWGGERREREDDMKQIGRAHV